VATGSGHKAVAKLLLDKNADVTPRYKRYAQAPSMPMAKRTRLQFDDPYLQPQLTDLYTGDLSHFPPIQYPCFDRDVNEQYGFNLGNLFPGILNNESTNLHPGTYKGPSPVQNAQTISTLRTVSHCCPLCVQVRFTTRGALRRHVSRLRHPEYAYVCPNCDFENGRRYKISWHCESDHPHIQAKNFEIVRRYHNQFPRNCVFCPHLLFGFPSRKSWWRHFETHCHI
jgi:hypothetical protein